MEVLHAHIAIKIFMRDTTDEVTVLLGTSKARISRLCPHKDWNAAGRSGLLNVNVNARTERVIDTCISFTEWSQWTNPGQQKRTMLPVPFESCRPRAQCEYYSASAFHTIYIWRTTARLLQSVSRRIRRIEK